MIRRILGEAKSLRLIATALVIVVPLGCAKPSAEVQPKNVSNPVVGVAIGGRYSLRPSPIDGGQSLLVYPTDANLRISYFCLYRSWDSEALQIIVNCSVEPKSVDFSVHFSANSIVHTATVRDDQLFLTVYDPEKNVPRNASSTGGEYDSVSVFRVSRDGRIEVVARLVPLSSVDSPIYLGFTRGGSYACDFKKCFRLLGGSYTKLAWPFDGSFDLVEVLIADNRISAIARRSIDRSAGEKIGSPSYFYIESNESAATAVEVPDDCIPFEISSSEGAPSPYRCVRTDDDVRRLLTFEIERFAFKGLMSFGSGNSEGRIVWGQFYYLAAFAAILDGRAQKVATVWGDVAPLRQRTCNEVELIARRGSSGVAGYQSKRYSLDRAPAVFALHLGRIATILALHRQIGCQPSQSEVILRALGLVRSELATLAATVEEMSEVPLPSGGAIRSLRYRTGSVFWADGAPVPYNYVSGAVAGAIDSAGDADDRSLIVNRYVDAIGYLINNEGLEQAQSWRYWWGFGATGWNLGQVPSLNTPTYVGYKERADISYRSIDAEALLAVRSVAPERVSGLVEGNIRRLVGEGALTPEVNGRLSRMGRFESLSRPAATYYARAASPGEIGSMVWALESVLQQQ